LTDVQEYRIELAITGMIPDPRATYACDRFRLVSCHPMGVPPDRSGKITVLTTDEALPIFDDELLESVVKESKFPAGKNAKQVPIEISKDVAEVERGRIR